MKFGLIKSAYKDSTYLKLLASGSASIFICISQVKRFYDRWFKNIIDGGKPSEKVKAIYDLINLPDLWLNTAIKAGCVVAGVFAVFAMMTILMIIINFALSISKKPLGYLLAEEEDELSKETIRKFRLWGFSLLALMAVLMFAFSSAQSFWVDELDWTIGKVANMTFLDITKQLLRDGYNMPLYYYALAVIYPLVPYGEGYLLSLGIVFVIIGIIILYFAAREMGGEKLGFIALCIASISSVLMSQGGWECRPYAFYFCFSALTLLFYVKRLKNENWGNILGFSVAMILLAYSHWFGAMILMFYAMSDLFLFVRKKINIRCIVSYLIAGAIILPWFVMMLLTVKSNLSSYWAGVPGLLRPVTTIRWLLSSNTLTFIVFAIAVAIMTAVLIQNILSKEWNVNLFAWIQMLLSAVFMIAATLIYSKFINPKGSIYVERYFFALVPQLILISAFGIQSAERLIKNDKSPEKRPNLIMYFAGFIVIVGISNYSFAILNITSLYEPYREAALYVENDEDAYLDKTVVVASTGGKSWIEYYFKKRGADIPNNIAAGYIEPLRFLVKNGIVIVDTSSYSLKFEELLEYDKVIYSRKHVSGNTEKPFLDFLEANYAITDEVNSIHITVYEK
ncbi:MAG: glycosyltransferase family 39 protein [Clostridiales bacterium]|nr:glycosyltransferase family 39 protein [Clostridiales bacterium]